MEVSRFALGACGDHWRIRQTWHSWICWPSWKCKSVTRALQAGMELHDVGLECHWFNSIGWFCLCMCLLSEFFPSITTTEQSKLNGPLITTPWDFVGFGKSLCYFPKIFWTLRASKHWWSISWCVRAGTHAYCSTTKHVWSLIWASHTYGSIEIVRCQ